MKTTRTDRERFLAEDVLKLRVDHDGAWWKFTLKALERAVRESAGRCIPSIGAFGACGDTLAAPRDTNRLLFDVVERPVVCSSRPGRARRAKRARCSKTPIVGRWTEGDEP